MQTVVNQKQENIKKNNKNETTQVNNGRWLGLWASFGWGFDTFVLRTGMTSRLWGQTHTGIWMLAVQAEIKMLTAQVRSLTPTAYTWIQHLHTTHAWEPSTYTIHIGVWQLQDTWESNTWLKSTHRSQDAHIWVFTVQLGVKMLTAQMGVLTITHVSLMFTAHMGVLTFTVCMGVQHSQHTLESGVLTHGSVTVYVGDEGT